MGEISYEPLIRDMTWSYSRLKAFNDCPYRWYLKYIRYPHTKGRNMFFASYGKFMHELIADYYSGEKTLVEIETEYLQEFRNKVNAYAPNKTIFRNYFLDGLNYLRNLKPPKNRVLSVENKVEFHIGDVPFIGYVDRTEGTPTGGIIVVDNKSRTLKPRSGRVVPTKTDQELDEYLRQLYLYSISIKNEYGSYPSELCFDCFRTQTVIREPFRVEKYEETKDWAKQTVERIASETDFNPDIEYFKCRYLCEMQDFCEYFELSKG